MYSKKYVIILIIALVLIFFSPLIYNISAPAFESEMPELQDAEGENCMEDAEWMKANHMDLLKDVRHTSIREMDRTYVSEDYGTEYNASIEQCFECHTSQEDFCGTCHEYNGVDPYCFECHSKPSVLDEYGEPQSDKYWQASSPGFK